MPEGCTVEYVYAEDGHLSETIITFPVTYTGNEIWIDGNPYVTDVPGFDLVPVSQEPSSVTILHDMYENGNKVGIMGGE